MMKLLPEEMLTASPLDRLKAHVDEGYELLPEDRHIWDEALLAFKVIHREDTTADIRKKLAIYFPEKDTAELRALVDSVTFLFQDLFYVNREAMRVIQEARWTHLYESAQAAGEYVAAGRALKAIDDLHRLAVLKEDLPIKNRRMPVVRLVSDPRALDALKAQGDD